MVTNHLVALTVVAHKMVENMNFIYLNLFLFLFCVLVTTTRTNMFLFTWELLTFQEKFQLFQIYHRNDASICLRDNLVWLCVVIRAPHNLRFEEIILGPWVGYPEIKVQSDI